MRALPDRRGYFGEFGGKYVPETLMAALDEFETAYRKLRRDKSFARELESIAHNYIGRPTPLTEARRFAQLCGDFRLFLKREDLNHTGAHKINNAIGQALIAKRMGKRRIIAETGAGQHGVATATACALFGLECAVYMGEVDMARQELNVFRMRLLGAEVVPVSSGSRTLKDAINEALRDWVTNVRTTHYILGSVLGPHPYPMIVRDFQSVIGREALEQIRKRTKKKPDVAVACVGGGSNSIGLFYEMLPHKSIRLVGVEAGGRGPNLGGPGVICGAGLSQAVQGLVDGGCGELALGEGQHPVIPRGRGQRGRQLLTAAAADRGPAQQREGYVAAHRGADRAQLLLGQAGGPQFVAGEQGRGGVGAAPGEPGGHRDPLGDGDVDAAWVGPAVPERCA